MKFLTPAMILSAGTLLSYLFGVMRDIIFANVYGASSITDAYFSAFLISDILLMICISSALLGIAIPLFMREREKNKIEGYNTYGIFFTSINSVFLGVCIIGIIFSPQLFQLLFPSQYSQNPDELVTLGRIFFASNFLFGISNFLGSFLMAHRHFLSTAIAPLLYNAGIMGGILLAGEHIGIYAAGWGALVGAFLHLSIRAIEYFWQPIRFPLPTNWESPALHELGKSMIFRWLTVASFPLIMLSISIYSSEAQSGLYTLFAYARNIESAPVAIFGAAIATAIFPVLSEHFAKQNTSDFQQEFWKSFFKTLFWTIPIGIGVFFCGSPLLQLIYGIDTPNQINSLNIIIPLLALAIPFESLSSLFARTFNAMGDTKTPLWIAAISLFSLILFLFFISHIGSPLPSITIGIAYSLTFVISSSLSIFFLFSHSEKPIQTIAFPKSFHVPFKIHFFAVGIMTALLLSGIQVFQNTITKGIFLPVFASFVYLIIILLFWRRDTLKILKSML